MATLGYAGLWRLHIQLPTDVSLMSLREYLGAEQAAATHLSYRLAPPGDPAYEGEPPQAIRPAWLEGVLRSTRLWLGAQGVASTRVSFLTDGQSYSWDICALPNRDD